MSASLAAFERPRLGISNTVFKSGPLFISSKGLGWKSWKKRWFILTRTSLVFFKSDPSTLPQRGGEVNLTLGGIDINNSGSVVIREDKKLLTVLFPDGRDGRAFTLKSETLEDLYEWKTALEQALAQAPSAALVMGHNGIFHGGATESADSSFLHWRDKRPVKSLVVGRPILLALEDIDGGPSFLEKALRFLEKYGIKVEGILRQSADVEEVDRRVEEYEQGRSEFDPDEDAHVVGDCVKHVLRQLPSSPVPASCCTALLEAYKNDRKEVRTNALRSAILETFPEPNRRLLQRIMKMMQTISSHASENRMTPSAVAACMAPLLLRPLLAGECELEDDFNSNGDNSAQLLAAANAANIAQAIITVLVEDYDIIFDQDILQRCSISAESRMDNSGSEDSTDDETLDTRDNDYHDAEHETDPESGEDNDIDRDRVLSGNLSESSCSAPSDLYDYKVSGAEDPNFGAIKNNSALSSKHKRNNDSRTCRGTNAPFNDQLGRRNKVIATEMDTAIQLSGVEPQRSMGEILSSMDRGLPQSGNGLETSVEKSSSKLAKPSTNPKASVLWGRNNAQKALSADSFDSSGEEELAIQRLEITKNDLRHRIAKEARGNAILQASLERRKQALRERRLALEQDVARLQEQLQAERDLRAALEVGLSMSSGQFSGSRGMDSKTRAELEEIALAEADVARLKQKVAELHHQLNQQRHHQYGSPTDGCDHYQHAPSSNFQPKYLQQDFDSTLAFCNHERKQRTEDFAGVDMRNLRAQVLTSGSNSNSNINISQPAARKQFVESARIADSKSTEASSSLSLDELGVVDSGSIPSTSRPAAEQQVMDYGRNSSAASSTLLELTTRLDFFKERRSQLMEQLHSLDINNYGTTGHDGMYNTNPSSPRWN